MFAEESPDWSIDPDGSDICEMCGEEAATIHLLRVENGAVTHSRLCQSCAETMAQQTEGMALVLAVPTVLRGPEKASGQTKRGVAPGSGENRVCNECGTTLADLKETGLVGCASCYQVFSDYLEEMVGAATGAVEHLGKVPRRGAETDVLRHEILRLQRMLRELVECERFEEAASVRDRLAELGERLAKELS